MSKIIINKVNELKERIKEKGKEINGTKELSGVTVSKIDVGEMDLLEEENNIRDYYTKLDINTQAVRSLEHNLREFIFRGLKQSVEQTLYFNKTQDYTSRRFVFSTTDCISHVQILYRPGQADLFMYMRSTDVVKLLPWDMLFACKLIKRVLKEAGFPATEKRFVTIIIGSAHYYLNPKALY